MAKDILFDVAAREKMKRGVETLAAAVAATLGPKGQVVVIDRGHGAPMATKDGVTVARAVDLKDPFEKMAADLVKEAAAKTNDVAGDGTTTATILTQAIYAEGHKVIAAGANPVSVKKGIEAATQEILKYLVAQAVPVDSTAKLEQVAGISANDKELGKTIAGLMAEVGPDGLITLEESPSFGIETEITKGMKIESGFSYPFMVTDPESMKAEIQDCPILVTDRRITMGVELLKLLESMAKAGQKNLLIICDHLEGEAVAIAAVNKQRGVFNIMSVRCPGIGEHRKKEIMRDICALTGATFVSDEMGKKLQDVDKEVLGYARKVILTKDHTTIIDGKGKQEDVDVRIGAVKSELATTKSDYDQQKLKERLASLTGAVGVIKVGGKNEVAIKEEKQRIEDAVNATRAASEEGIVTGGGVALIRAGGCVQDLAGDTDFNSGVRAVLRAIERPLQTLAENAGRNGEVVLGEVMRSVGSFGYNAATGDYEDLVAAGIVDPLKVTRTALENASSIACLLLTTKAVIVNEPPKA